MQSTFETLHNFSSGSCNHVLGNEKVHTYQVLPQKKKKREINSNFKELAIFPRRIKGIDSQKFSRIANAISEQRLVMLRSDVFVTADGQISPESFDVTK